VGEDGIEVLTVSQFSSPDYSADAVVSQDPSPGSRAPRVSLLVNRGESSASYLMPDLTGLNGERAAEVLRTRGLRVSIVGSQPSPSVPPGTVVRQQPAEGFQIDPSDSISLEVSR
jgi:beta-lactam-binding protein with PASTA domain